MIKFIYKIVVLLFCFLPLFTQAQLNANKAQQIFNSLDDDRSNDSRTIQVYGDSLLDYFQQHGNHCEYIRTLLYVKSLHLKNGDFQAALKTLFLAFSKAKTNLCFEYPALPDVYASYANLYASINDDKRALYYTNLGLKEWKNIWVNKRPLIRLYLLKSGFCKSESSQIYYGNLALQSSIETNDKVFEENAMTNLGTLYAINGRNEKATYYLKQALGLALQRKAYAMIPALYNNLAGITTSTKDVLKYVDSSLQYAQLTGNLDDQLIAWKNLALIHYNAENYKEGYDALWSSFVLQDSLFNRNRVIAFTEMEQKYEAKKKGDEIEILRKENHIALLQSSRRLIVSLSLAGALLAFIFVAFIFYNQNLKKKKLNIELTHEKKKSDDLLLNILPEEVADELKQTGTSKARLYNNVSVLFTDFVNFTGISEQLSPTELVQEIHNNFTAFDAIIEKHGLEKIKTIGDAYLAVCGLPHELHDHAIRVTRAAIDIRNYMAQNEGKFKIRIGIHSGPVVAGIVGVKKYAYDIWGDTVNMANRMESNSEVGKINISGATHELIANHFYCNYRGKINAKNKGEVDMYFVE